MSVSFSWTNKMQVKMAHNHHKVLTINIIIHSWSTYTSRPDLAPRNARTWSSDCWLCSSSSLWLLLLISKTECRLSSISKTSKLLSRESPACWILLPLLFPLKKSRSSLPLLLLLSLSLSTTSKSNVSAKRGSPLPSGATVSAWCRESLKCCNIIASRDQPLVVALVLLLLLFPLRWSLLRLFSLLLDMIAKGKGNRKGLPSKKRQDAMDISQVFFPSLD